MAKLLRSKHNCLSVLHWAPTMGNVLSILCFLLPLSVNRRRNHFFYSLSVQGGRVLAPFTHMQHLLLWLLTSSPPSPHAQTVTHRACMVSLARVEEWMGWPFLHAWHPKCFPQNARKLNRLLVLVLEELRLLFTDGRSINYDFYLRN